MISKNAAKALSLALTFVLVTASSPSLYGLQSPTSAPATDSGNPTDVAPQSATELQSLVAPIALYPDALVAQVLTAATFPDQVAIANYWLQQNKNLTGTALMQAVDKQTWDPSVKALTEFPSVLNNMSQNLSWTSSLGEAYHGQQAEVMTAIQTCRAQAKAKGNLTSSTQIKVTQQSPDVIVIQPANPQIVYVPQYNPTIIYGMPYVVPGYVVPVYTTGDVVAAGLIGFGTGIAVGAMMSGGCCGWGYSSWNCGWHGTAVVYHGGAYYGNSSWHGGYYNGGYHNGYGYNNAYNHSNNYNNAYNHSNNYNHSNSGNTYKGGGNTFNNVNVNKQSAQNFNSNHSSASNSWAQHSSGGKSDAFSGMSGHSGGFGDSGGSGWSSRADSSRGWGSMHSSGFSGGRFGGGGGGFGGGGFHGGGRR
jgi:hypothetical protein